jgi:hypothetical protein
VTAGTSAFLSTDRRKSLRMGTTIPALIHVGDGVPQHPCAVLDVSQGGARIRLNADAQLPDRFSLFFNRAGSVRRACRLIWRRNCDLGVVFDGPFDNL